MGRSEVGEEGRKSVGLAEFSLDWPKSSFRFFLRYYRKTRINFLATQYKTGAFGYKIGYSLRQGKNEPEGNSEITGLPSQFEKVGYCLAFNRLGNSA